MILYFKTFQYRQMKFLSLLTIVVYFCQFLPFAQPSRTTRLAATLVGSLQLDDDGAALRLMNRELRPGSGCNGRERRQKQKQKQRLLLLEAAARGRDQGRELRPRAWSYHGCRGVENNLKCVLVKETCDLVRANEQEFEGSSST